MMDRTDIESSPPGDDKHLDFTIDDPSPGAVRPLTIEKQPFDPTPQREQMRGHLAIGLLVLLAVTIAACFTTLWWGLASSADTLQIIELILGPLITLVGTATGFYFGSASNK